MSPRRSLNSLAGWLALIAIAFIIILNGAPFFTNASKPPRGISSPVIALEVARGVDEVDAILGEAPSPDREAMRIKQYVDFGFIACYAALYATLGFMLRARAAWLAMGCGIAAAIADVFENLAILRIVDVPLRRTTQTMVDAIRFPGLAKWTLVFVAAALFGAVFWKERKRSWRLIAVLNFVTAALGFFGIYDNSFLVWAGIPLVGGLAALIAVFLLFR